MFVRCEFWEIEGSELRDSAGGYSHAGHGAGGGRRPARHVRGPHQGRDRRAQPPPRHAQAAARQGQCTQTNTPLPLQ